MVKCLAVMACFVLVFSCAHRIPAPLVPIQSMQTSINQHRVLQGCKPLIWDKRVAFVAQSHSLDMANHHFFDHTNKKKQSFGDRVLAQGLNYKLVGENLAMGSLDVLVILNGWLDSPGHRANIENCDFTHHGIGLSQSYWTHVFFTPQLP